MRRQSLLLGLCLVGCTFGFERELEWSDIRGTIVFVGDSQQPVVVEGARVVIEGAGLTASSDSRGRFVLRGLPAGAHALRVSHTADDGVERGLRLRVSVGTAAQAPGEGLDLGRLTIGRLGSLSGTVLWEGEPAPDTRVALDGRDAVLTDLNGDFRHENLLPGTYEVVAFRMVGDVLQSSEPVELEVAPGKSQALPLVLSKVEGKARVEGAALLAGQISHAGIVVSLRGSDGGTHTTETDARGSWAATLPVGEYVVEARADGYMPASLPHFALTRDRQAPTLLLVACPEGGCEEPPPPDSDGDGVPDDTDNCPDTPNPDQDDRNENGIGDACDDSDEDGVLDDVDNCPDTPNPEQDDWNENGVGDACEDSDSDDVLDDADNCPDTPNPGQEDWNENGVGDACEDSDEDGVPDGSDNCREIPNPDQRDVDGDGAGDACDDESGLCGDDWCFEFPTPGPSGAVGVEASATGDLWVSYRKAVARRSSEGWRSSLVLGSQFNGTFDVLSDIGAMTMGPDDDLWIGGSGNEGLIARHHEGEWSVDDRSALRPLSLVSFLGDVYSFSFNAHHRLTWPDGEIFDALTPAQLVRGVATLPSGLMFFVHDDGPPLRTTDALTFEPLDDPSLDLSEWSYGGRAFAIGVDAFLVGPGVAVQATEGGSGLTWRQFSLPGLNEVHGVTGSAHDDVWVYGWSDIGPPMLLHFDGVDWTRHSTGFEDEIVGLVAKSPSQAEAVLSSGLHLTWDGVRWSSTDDVSSTELWSVAATGPGDAWAVDSAGGLHRWGDDEWQPVALPGTGLATGVVAAAANDVWAFGPAALWHFDGTTWSEHPDASLLPPEEAWIRGWVSAPEDVWLWDGFDVLRFDGTRFDYVEPSEMGSIQLIGGAPGTAPWAVTFDGIYRWSEVDQTFAFEDQRLQGSEPLGFVVHGEDDIELIDRYGDRLTWNGIQWSFAESVLPSDFDGSLVAMWPAPDGTLWAVSEEGELLRRESGSTGPLTVVSRLPFREPLGISGFGEELWVVGRTSVHLGPNGSSSRLAWWSETELGHVWVSADGSEGLAPDGYGGALSRTNGRWTPVVMKSETDSPVWMVAGRSTANLRGLTDWGEPVRFDGVWRYDDSLPDVWFTALWARSATEFWAVSDDAVYRDTGSGWQPAFSADRSGYRAITGDETHVYAASPGGVDVFDGTSWSFDPTERPLVALAVAPDTGELFGVEEGSGPRLAKRAVDGTWSLHPIDSPAWNTCNRAHDVVAPSATEVWVTSPWGQGSTANACPPFLGRFDGSDWHVDAALPPTRIVRFFLNESGVWGAGRESAIVRLRATR